MLVEGRFPADDERLTIEPPPFTEMRQRRADRPDVAHDVELPVGVPLLVADLRRSARSGRCRRCSRGRRARRAARAASSTTRSGSPARVEVGHDMRLLADARCVPRRPHETTRAPSPASCRTTSSPMPAVEPVTRQRLPSSPRSTCLGYPACRRRSSSSDTARPTGIASAASRATQTCR